jgi:outer membrane receptor protein involved in Fe transport
MIRNEAQDSKSKRRLLAYTSTALAGILCSSLVPGLAHAQSEPAPAQTVPPPAQPDPSEAQIADVPGSDIVVTGSRISREGFTAPTPVTTLGSAEIETRNPTTVGEILSTIPSFRSVLSSTGGGTRTRGGAVDRADLRGLNDTFATRTLVLVDGRRFVPSGSDGAVDMKLIPTTLIEQVEVVTGGASAAWGSDAVAGVVNFKLKQNMRGLQGTVSYGISEQGDSQEYRLSLGTGFSLMGGRLHGVIGGDYVKNEGIQNQYSRDWGRKEYGLITNTAFATNGLANFIISPNVHPSNMTPGGLIVSGPLRGVAFGPGGAPSNFTFGQVFGTSMIGGDNVGQNLSNATLLQTPIKAVSGFGHVDFDASPDITVFGELMGAWSRANGQTQQPRDAGNLVIQRDNAYLPGSIRDAMIANNLQTITVGRLNNDTGAVLSDARNTTWRGVFGAKGNLGGSWKWDAYYQYGQNQYGVDVGPNNRIQSNWAQAIDAVRDPATGAIVCRSATAVAAGCKPINIFGDGSAMPNSYAFGTAHFESKIKQQVVEANLRGDPFSTWAGPVSIAVGGGYRKESLSSAADPLSYRPNPNGSFGAWAFNNQQPVSGSYDLWEIYGEVLVPLLKDVPFAKSFDLNAAARRTDYSLSGAVTTWKVGLTWEPVDGVRVRATRSRDIRAPNLGELFEGGGSAQAVVPDRVLGSNVQVFDLAIGNLNLRPEVAKTWTAGVVYEPSFVPGLQLSVDYYNIKIDGAISSLSPELRVRNCYNNVPGACDSVVFNPNGTIAYIKHASENLNSLKTSGIDMELFYQSSLDPIGVPGKASLRLLGTYVDNLTQLDASGALDKAGWLSLNSRVSGVPKFSGTAEFTYNNQRWGFGLLGKLIGSGKFNTLYSTGAGAANTINKNEIPAYFYLSLNAHYDLTIAGKDISLFGVVNNLTNTDPPMIPSGAVGNAAETATNPTFYDVIGRSYKVGIRFKF